MGKYDKATVTIKRWADFNLRKDVTHPSWFRVEYRLLEDPDFFNFSHGEFKAWFYLMAQACRKNSASIRVNYPHAKTTARLSEKEIDGAIEKLLDLGHVAVSVTSTIADVTSTIASDTRHDMTDKTDMTDITNTCSPAARFDFEGLYRKYPRKAGKQKGITRARSQVKTPEEFAALSAAIDRYSNYIRAEGTEAKYVKHFSTFMADWRDWLDPETGTGPAPPKARGIAEILADDDREAS